MVIVGFGIVVASNHSPAKSVSVGTLVEESSGIERREAHASHHGITPATKAPVKGDHRGPRQQVRPLTAVRAKGAAPHRQASCN